MSELTYKHDIAELVKKIKSSEGSVKDRHAALKEMEDAAHNAAIEVIQSFIGDMQRTGQRKTLGLRIR